MSGFQTGMTAMQAALAAARIRQDPPQAHSTYIEAARSSLLAILSQLTLDITICPVGRQSGWASVARTESQKFWNLMAAWPATMLTCAWPATPACVRLSRNTEIRMRLGLAALRSARACGGISTNWSKLAHVICAANFF